MVLLRTGEGPGLLWTRESFAALTGRAREAVGSFLRERPLRPGLPKEELRSRLGQSPRLFAAALASWVERGELSDAGQSVSLPGWSPRLTPDQQRLADAYIDVLRSTPFSPPTDKPPPADLLSYLEETGQVVDVGAGVVFEWDAYDQMVTAIVGRIREQGKITLAEVRDLFGTTRKYTQALLEHLDQARVTARQGDERVLGRGSR